MSRRGGGRGAGVGEAVLAVAVAYLLGSISFGFLIARYARRTDIRRAGSGNPGATNVLRTLGWKAAAPVLLLDILKGTLAVLFARWIGTGPLVQSVAALAAVAGHDWPVWLRFKGGRGVATSVGALAVFAPVPTGIAAAVFAATVGLTRYVSLGSLLGSAAMFPAMLVIWAVASGAVPQGYLVYAAIGPILIWVAHADNIDRLIHGTERKFDFGQLSGRNPTTGEH